MQLETFIAFLAKLNYYHDPYANGHGENTKTLVRGLAEAHGYPAAKLENLLLAAQLHDVGKLLVSESVLNKQSRLTPMEISAIHEHTKIGYNALAALGLDPLIPQVALEHHEDWDGTGYPHGLRGENICIEARMVAIADCFDALTSPRSYRQALSTVLARETMLRSSGRFDPDLLSLFFAKVVTI